MQKELSESNYHVVFDTAISILGETTETISYKYIVRRATRLFFEARKTLGKDLFEIRFKKERVTLLCIFGQNRMCNLIYIFLDNQCDLFFIQRYLDKRYPDGICLNFWLSGNYKISIETSDFDSFIKIFTVNRFQYSSSLN